MERYNIEDVVTHRDYRTLEGCLEHDSQAVLNVLYDMTRSGSLSTKQHSSRELWRGVLVYCQSHNQNERVEEICTKLAQIEKSEFRGEFEEHLKGVAGAIAMVLFLADPYPADRISERLAKYFERKATQRYLRMLTAP